MAAFVKFGVVAHISHILSFGWIISFFFFLFRITKQHICDFMRICNHCGWGWIRKLLNQKEDFKDLFWKITVWLGIESISFWYWSMLILNCDVVKTFLCTAMKIHEVIWRISVCNNGYIHHQKFYLFYFGGILVGKFVFVLQRNNE